MKNRLVSEITLLICKEIQTFHDILSFVMNSEGVTMATI